MGSEGKVIWSVQLSPTDSLSLRDFSFSILILIFPFYYESPMQLGSAEHFLQESKSLIFGNGNDKPPTGFMFEKQQMHGLYFNQSPAKVLLLFKLCYSSK